MDVSNSCIALGFIALGIVALIGFFTKMLSGFGKFNTSTLILIMVLTIVPILLVNGSIESSDAVNILFAVAGFAGGLLSSKQ